MGERIAASIQLGGKLRRDQVGNLINALDNYCLLGGEYHEEEPNEDNLGTEFYSFEVNYGNLDEVIDIARQTGLSYRYWCDSGSEWTEQTILYDGPTGNEVELIGHHRGELGISERMLKQLGLAGALACFDRARAPLPPLEIEP